MVDELEQRSFDCASVIRRAASGSTAAFIFGRA